jgi:CheY-like chemotaxis protein/nitrogen-specific signal transduction histidine kinase
VDGASSLEGIVISAIDVTQKVRARRELEAEARRKDEFLAMLAHELRNPLAALSSALELLNMRLPPDDSLMQATQIARRQIHHMGRLLDDLLDVSRISRGKITLRNETVALGDTVKEAIQSITPLFESKGQQLEITVPAEPIFIRGDSSRLVQILVNLLANAAKYTPCRGHIRLTVGRFGDEAQIHVQDDGMGIPADLLPRVFDLFSQSQQSLARTQGGLGIGLTLVKRLVEMHGGRVEAHSEGLNQGSEFVVALPRLANAEEHLTEQGTPECAHPSRLHILVVEDNPDNAEALVALLKLEGHHVLLAQDGMTALEMAQQHELDVVLLDIGLPGLDGYEVAHRLTQRRDKHSPKIIAISGYGDDMHRAQGNRTGIQQFLLKPVGLKQLRRALLPDGQQM